MTYAFGEGIDAFDDGKPASSNPHHYDANESSDWSEWQAGWRVAQKRAARNDAFVELPDSIRVPLGEIWADLPTHFARAARDGKSTATYLAHYNCSKITLVKDAIDAALRSRRFALKDSSSAMKVGDTVAISVKIVEVSDTNECWKGALTDRESAIWFDADDIAVRSPVESDLISAAWDVTDDQSGYETETVAVRKASVSRLRRALKAMFEPRNNNNIGNANTDKVPVAYMVDCGGQDIRFWRAERKDEARGCAVEFNTQAVPLYRDTLA